MTPASTAGDRQLPPAPPSAVAVFGPRLELAERYGAWLASVGVVRGLIGPREVPRLWERHLLNCAVVSDLLPMNAQVVDVGSGAGLPGLCLTIRRPDLKVVLVDSLARRTDFLTEVIGDLGLSSNVSVVRGRAEDPLVVKQVGGGEWVMARAVAPLDRLSTWCLPLVRAGGRLLALKGSGAEVEISQYASAISRAGGVGVAVVTCGAGVLDDPTTVVVVERSASVVRSGRR